MELQVEAAASLADSPFELTLAVQQCLSSYGPLRRKCRLRPLFNFVALGTVCVFANKLRFADRSLAPSELNPTPLQIQHGGLVSSVLLSSLRRGTSALDL